jgi:hypothetical protein
MNRRLFGAFGVVAVVAFTVGGCKSDPLSDVDGTPSDVITSFSYLQLPIGGSATVNATVLDARATPLEVPITFTPCTADVSVATDTSYHPVPATSAQVIVTAVSANASCVLVAGGGIEDTVSVAVLPAGFGGTFSSATPKGGDTLTITSTATLKFDTATVAVTFGAAGSGPIVSKSRDAVKVLVPFGSAGPVTIDGIEVTYAAGLVVSLASTTTVTTTGDFWVGDDAYATAPAINLPAAGGQSTFMITNLPAADNTAICGEASGPCALYAYTVADSTELTFSVDWDSAADIDIYSCEGPSAGTCFEDGGAGATGAQPQEFTFTAAPGTHYFSIENFDHVPTANLRVTITRGS